MKKIYFTLGLGVLLLGANAQQLNTKAFHKNAANTSLHLSARTQSTVTDTLVPSSIADSTCGANLSYYQFDAAAPIDSGYIFGTNMQPVVQGGVTYSVSLTEFAEKYTVTGTASVTAVLTLAAKAYSSASTTSLTSVVYSQDVTTLGPSSSVLGTSSGKSLSTFTTSGFNMLSFATPVSVPAGNFFVSVTSPVLGDATHDTLALLTTSIGCSTADSLSWEREVATASGGTQVLNAWISVKSLLGANLDIAIFPIITMNTAGIDKVTKGGLSLYAAYPNPANSTININFSLDKSSKVDVEIYDITGKVVKTISNNNLATGANSVSVDVSTLEAGSYLYSINANGNKMFSKFVVTK